MRESMKRYISDTRRNYFSRPLGPSVSELPGAVNAQRAWWERAIPTERAVGARKHQYF